MLSCWSTWWQPPQKNTSLLNHDICWLNPKLVLSSRTEFLAWLCTCSCFICHSLMQGWRKAKWEKSSNKHEMEITDHRIARTLNSGRTRDDWKQLLKEMKTFLPWNIQNKINWLNFTSSHEKIHFWNASPVFKIFCIQTIIFLHLVPFYRSSYVTPLYVLVGRKIWLGINTVLLYWLLRAPQNMMWLSHCPMSH